MSNEVVIDKDAFRRKVERLTNIPTLPNLLNKFTEMIKNPKTSMDAIGKELSKDQVLTSKLLKLVNSAFYGFPGRISTVTHALVLLGYDAVKGLIITSNIFENLSSDAYPLWRHSIASSLACRSIANELLLEEVEEFAVAGLLHDIGKVILHIEASDEYKLVIEHARSSGKSIFDTEREMLGFDHANIGQWICEKWTLPSKLIIPIGCHHDMSDKNTIESYKMRVVVTSLSDMVVRAMGCCAEGDLPLEPLDPAVEENISLKPEQMQRIVEKVEPEIEALQHLVPEDMK